MPQQPPQVAWAFALRAALQGFPKAAASRHACWLWHRRQVLRERLVWGGGRAAGDGWAVEEVGGMMGTLGGQRLREHQ